MAGRTLTETLIDHVLAVRFDALPQAAVDMARHVTLDGIAVMLAGATGPLGIGRISIDYVREMGGAPQASVVAGGFKTSMQNAAYANGTMAHALDFDNTWYVNRPQPKTGLDGKFSVQYATAVALLDGEVTVDSFDDARRFAPDAVALLGKTELHFDDTIPKNFDRMHCVVTVKLTDGRSLEKKVDKLSGWIGFPLTAEQRLKKFDACARRVLPDDAAARVVELVGKLDRLADVRGIMDVVRCQEVP